MTKSKDKKKYESLVEGQQLIESQLHLCLIELLNVEIVLQTVVNLNSAINWLKSTFFYTRLKKNPQYYGIGLDKNSLILNTQNCIDLCLKELCIKSLNNLMEVNLIEKCDFILNPDSMLRPTMSGQLMARYCTAFDTMSLIIRNVRESNSEYDNTKTFLSLESLINIISQSKELEDIKLRTSEKSLLNSINNNGKVPKADANISNMIRYVQLGKVKTNQMKINILIQAQLGSIQFNDLTLSQDIFKIFQVGQRISRCLFEYQLQVNNHELTGTSNRFKNYLTFLNSVILYKNFVTKLWFDSPHLFKQFNRIGAALSMSLVNAGICSFEDILKTSPRVLERILNKNPPYGNRILETIEKLPRFKIEFNTESITDDEIYLDVICSMENYDYISSLGDGGCLGLSNQIMFVVGDEHYNLLYATRWNNNSFLKNNGLLAKRLNLNEKENGNVVHASLVMLQFVGLDVHESFEAVDWVKSSAQHDQSIQKRIAQPRKKAIRFQYDHVVLDEEDQEDGEPNEYDDYSNDVFEISNPSPVKQTRKRKYDQHQNLDTLDSTAGESHANKSVNLEAKPKSKSRIQITKIQTNKIDSYFLPKKFEDLQKIISYSPSKEKSPDHLSALFEEETDEKLNEQNCFKKSNFVQSSIKELNQNQNETYAAYSSNKIKLNVNNRAFDLAIDKENNEPRKFDFNSKRLQINKIDSYFESRKNEDFQRTNAIKSESSESILNLFQNELCNNSSNFNEIKQLKRKYLDDALDLPIKEKTLILNSFELDNFNL